MKVLLILTCTLLFSLVHAQKQGSGVFSDPLDLRMQNIQADVLDVTPDAREVKKQQVEDQLLDSLGGFAYRFGYVVNTSKTFRDWETTPIFDGQHWHFFYPITSNGAQTINLGLTDLMIPTGDRLYFQNEEGSNFYGPFVQNDIYKGELGTELLPGDRAFLHYISSTNEGLNGILSVVNHGYRSLAALENYAKSTCQIDVNCPEGDDYSRVKDAVVILINSSNATFCSGTLLANTQYDGKPYVLTANHCYFSVPTGWVFRFNYQATTCSSGVSEETVSLNGGAFRARYNPSDFLLVEITGGLIDGQLPTATNAYFSGWDFTGRDLHHAVGIHHPSGAMKKISFDDHLIRKASVQSGNFTSLQNGVWRLNWDRGTSTENKSSGSGLFDSYKRLVGQLWGGSSSCTNPNGADFYGRFHLSWNHRPDTTEQLEYWLDPTGLSNGVIDGHGIGQLPLNKDVALSLQPQFNAICGATDSLYLLVSNVGHVGVNQVELQYTFDNWATQQTRTISESIARLRSLPVYFLVDDLSAGWHQFAVRIQSVDGGLDLNPENDTLSYRFHVMEDQNTIDLALNLDCYASENYFLIRNEDGEVVFNGPYYADFADKGLHEYSICLADGCYTFEIFDAYGDGFSYNNGISCTSGHLILSKGTTVLAEIPQDQANFGASEVIPFCVGPLSVDEVLASEFSVSPNPTKNKVTVTSERHLDEIHFYSLDGRLLTNTILEAAQSHVLPINLASGCYILCAFKDGVSQFSTKVIVE